MATLPITGLLPLFEVLALQALDFIAQLNHFLEEVPHRGDQLRERVARATDLYQLAVHVHLGLPQPAKKEKRLLPFHPHQERPAWTGSAKLYGWDGYCGFGRVPRL